MVVLILFDRRQHLVHLEAAVEQEADEFVLVVSIVGINAPPFGDSLLQHLAVLLLVDVGKTLVNKLRINILDAERLADLEFAPLLADFAAHEGVHIAFLVEEVELAQVLDDGVALRHGTGRGGQFLAHILFTTLLIDAETLQLAEKFGRQIHRINYLLRLRLLFFLGSVSASERSSDGSLQRTISSISLLKKWCSIRW